MNPQSGVVWLPEEVVVDEALPETVVVVPLRLVTLSALPLVGGELVLLPEEVEMGLIVLAVVMEVLFIELDP